MPINATESTVLDATYDKWAISEFRTYGDALSGYGESAVQPVRVFVRMIKYRVRDDGIPERSPILSDSRSFDIPDLYAALESDPLLAQAMQSLTTAVAAHASQLGVL